MNDKIKIKIFEDAHYTIKYLYRKHINVYNIEYSKSGNIYTVDASALDKLNPEEIEVISYMGVKGFLFKIKRHRHFIISIILSIILMFLLSNIVIDIDVIHSDKEIRTLLEEELQSNGIHPFMIKKSFNKLQEIKEKIKDKHPDKIEWFEIESVGMKYIVRVEERIITEDKEEKSYCDVISNKDAIVLSSQVSSGQNKVTENDYVKKGSTLISGSVTFNEENKAYTCADGVVWGNTWYTVSVSVPLKHKTKIYTKNTQKNIGIEIGSKLYEIFKVHLDKYDTDKKKIFSFGNFAVYSETSKEYKTVEKEYTENEATDEALKLGREKLYLNLDKDASILSEKVLQTNQYDSIIEMDIFYSVKEIISEQVEREIPKEEEGVKSDEST